MHNLNKLRIRYFHNVLLSSAIFYPVPVFHSTILLSILLHSTEKDCARNHDDDIANHQSPPAACLILNLLHLLK